MQKSRIEKIRVVFATIFILFTIFSITFSTFEKHHECVGEDCPICFVIQVSQESLKLFVTALAIFKTFISINKFSNQQKIFSENSVLKFNSLVLLKIKIND